MDTELADKFVGMYVNKWTLGYGEKGKQAVKELIKRGTKAGLLPGPPRLRARAEQIAKAELERTFASLGDNLTEKQRQSIEAMAKAIINKLLHQPTAKLRETAPEQLDHRLAGAAAELFGLESEDPKR